MFNPTRAGAAMPAQDFERAKSFYADKLGFKPFEENDQEARYQVGSSEFIVFPSMGKASGDHTQLGFEVESIEEAVADLRANGVVFEEYDMPGFKTENGIIELEGEKAAFFKDSEGNVIALGERAAG